VVSQKKKNVWRETLFTRALHGRTRSQQRPLRSSRGKFRDFIARVRVAIPTSAGYRVMSGEMLNRKQTFGMRNDTRARCSTFSNVDGFPIRHKCFLTLCFDRKLLSRYFSILTSPRFFICLSTRRHCLRLTVRIKCNVIHTRGHAKSVFQKFFFDFRDGIIIMTLFERQ